MRSVLLFLVTLPLLVSSQVNRSAKQLASETIEEYITSKLFKNQLYHPVSFGELKLKEEENTGVNWSYDHKFEITANKTTSDKNTAVTKIYKFIFYLDKRMKVKRADGAFID